MRGRFCYIAELNFGREEFFRLVEALKIAGITLANPWNGVISKLTDDGDQAATSETLLADAVWAGSQIMFQFWLSDDTDLICSMYPLSKGISVHRYNLDGLDLKERTVVEGWAVSYFKERAAAKAVLLLIVDGEALTAEFDWDAFVEGRCGPPDRNPEIVGIFSQLEIECDGAVQCLSDCRLFTNRRGD